MTSWERAARSRCAAVGIGRQGDLSAYRAHPMALRADHGRNRRTSRRWCGLRARSTQVARHLRKTTVVGDPDLFVCGEIDLALSFPELWLVGVPLRLEWCCRLDRRGPVKELLIASNPIQTPPSPSCYVCRFKAGPQGSTRSIVRAGAMRSSIDHKPKWGGRG
jgi:hypothetical protein